MSANTSAAGTPGASSSTSTSGAPVRPGDAASRDQATYKMVIRTLPKIFALERQGNLAPNLAHTVRGLLTSQLSEIMWFWASVAGPDPLLDIPPALNPSLDYKESKARVPPQVFQAKMAEIRALIKARIEKGELVPRPEAEVMAATSGGTGGVGGARAPARPPGVTMPPVQPPPGILSIQIISTLVKDAGAREAWINEKREMRQAQWSQSVQWWTEYQSRQRALAAGRAGAGATGGPGQPGYQARPFNLQMPQQVETEPDRRRRKFREYLQEQAPGMELELGANGIMSDVLDTFVDDCVRGAIRLAKHRKSDRVETRDMAAFLDMSYGMSVPGFDALVPRRTHLQPEGERKRGRGVAPKAARFRGNAKEE